MKHTPKSDSAEFPGSKAVLFMGWVGLLLSSLSSPPAVSQQIGDAEKGRQFALEACTECHAVRPAEPRSPVPEAARFEDVANTPGITAIALTALFQTSHPTMPNIVMTDAQTRDVIQYILSLKKD
jgi:mono/diheme cytochrome c family protein